MTVSIVTPLPTLFVRHRESRPGRGRNACDHVPVETSTELVEYVLGCLHDQSALSRRPGALEQVVADVGHLQLLVTRLVVFLAGNGQLGAGDLAAILTGVGDGPDRHVLGLGPDAQPDREVPWNEEG